MKRCNWCLEHDIYIDYHDKEWGVPTFDDESLFEMLLLEGIQAGLSWITVLKKRENYRLAYDSFDAMKIANYDENKEKELLSNSGIIRNKLKIKASISNARCYLNIKQTYPSFKDYIWRFVEGVQITNFHNDLHEVPATSPISDKMSKELKRDGFKFVGSTILYAYMQSIGMVNDHITSCFRHQQIMDTFSNLSK